MLGDDAAAACEGDACGIPTAAQIGAEGEPAQRGAEGESAQPGAEVESAAERTDQDPDGV